MIWCRPNQVTQTEPVVTLCSGPVQYSSVYNFLFLERWFSRVSGLTLMGAFSARMAQFR
jgi:hypothetical protein